MKQKHRKYTQINTKKSMHSEIDPVRQNPIQRTVRTAHLCVLDLKNLPAWPRIDFACDE